MRQGPLALPPANPGVRTLQCTPDIGIEEAYFEDRGRFGITQEGLRSPRLVVYP